MIDAAGWIDAIASRWNRGPSAASLEQATERIERRHGDAGRAFVELALDPNADRGSLYAAKNATLALTLDVSLTWSGDLYRLQLPMLAERMSTLLPRRIVDVGCENGLVTCFIATAAPDAEVVGVDRCPEAVGRARELAGELGVGNVSFETRDLVDHPIAVGRDAADVVVCGRSIIGEAVPGADDRPAELLPGCTPADTDWQADAGKAARALAGLLKHGGVLVSVERCGTSGAVRWAAALADAGFAVDAPISTLTVDEPGNPGERFRFMSASSTGLLAPRPGTAELLGALGVPAGTGTHRDEEAELAALSVTECDPIVAWERVNSAADTEHVELARLPDGRGIELRCSTNGARDVVVMAADEVEGARRRLAAEARALEGAGTSAGRPGPAASQPAAASLLGRSRG